uniref:Uncharacterized protein n=1 Tax=Lactuca sativa TaxID=4236 RepID=A0A9R1VJ64_LACSA|nr:hypothetical protein LSAT_V11C500241740 [Lactuca sativa]
MRVDVLMAADIQIARLFKLAKESGRSIGKCRSRIGASVGLESMTTNPMAWEGSVNPKYHFWTILPISSALIAPSENQGTSPRLSSSSGNNIRLQSNKVTRIIGAGVH